MPKQIKTYEEFKNAEKMIIDHFKVKGYKKLGRGGEAIVFGNNTEVFRVILPKVDRYDFDSEDRGRYEQSLRDANYVTTQWLKYIKKNSDNPHLPKFTPASPINISGHTFSVTKMERLKRINPDTDTEWIILENIINSLNSARGNVTTGLKETYERVFQTYYLKGAKAKQPIDLNNYSSFKTFFPGKTKIEFKDFQQRFNELYSTVYDVWKTANRDSRLQEDISETFTSWQNFMIRAVGKTIVITDPWMAFERD